jgi:molybdopterin-biosynthesis enzyme MoeA-like protein
MARIPNGATLIANPVSGAPGFQMENVYVMAGVPRIFAAMVAEVLSTLARGAIMGSVTVRVARPEGDIAEALGTLATEHDAVSFGSYPFREGEVLGAALVARSTDPTALEAAKVALENLRKS